MWAVSHDLKQVLKYQFPSNKTLTSTCQLLVFVWALLAIILVLCTYIEDKISKVAHDNYMADGALHTSYTYILYKAGTTVIQYLLKL